MYERKLSTSMWKSGVVVVMGGPDLEPCVLMIQAWGPMCRVWR